MNTYANQLSTLVPASRHLGTEVLEARGGRARVRFDHIPELLDEAGQLKPAALLALGKTSSASALFSLLDGRLAQSELRFVNANARSNRPSRGALMAEAEVLGFRDAIVRDLDRTGSSTIRLAVTIEDESERAVSELIVDWHVQTVAGSLRKAA